MAEQEAEQPTAAEEVAPPAGAAESERAPTRGPQTAVGTPSAAVEGGADQPRKSANLMRNENIQRSMRQTRYDGQSDRVRPGGFGDNYDKAGVKPFKPGEKTADKDLSAAAIGPPPSNWQNRVIDTVPSAQVNPADPGHTYHVLDDKTVVSTSEPATVDPRTAEQAADKVEEKQNAQGKPDPEVAGILQRLSAIKMETASWSTTAESREKIGAAEAEIARLEEKIDKIRAQRKRRTPITPVKKELEKAKANLAQVKKDWSDPLKAKPGEEKPDAKKDDDSGDAKKKSAGQWVKDHTEVKGNVVDKKKTLAEGGVSLLSEKHKDEDGPLGSKRTGETNLLNASGKAEASLTAGKDGVNANLTAEGKATLVDLQEKWEWRFPFEFMGEDVQATLYLMAKGMVGAEAKAQLAANVKGLNPAEPKINENAVMAGVDAFAGAKVQLGVGAALEWNKKPAKDYQGKLASSAQAITKILYAYNPALGWLLDNLGAEAATEQLLDWLFEWGKQGKTPLLGVEAIGEASAGVGAAANAAIGLRGGKFEFQAKANATWGVGLGGKVKVMLDVVEGPKFAVLSLGELFHIAEAFAKEQIDKVIAEGLELAGAIWDWLKADDKCREIVANAAHELVGPKERATIISTLLEGWCGNDDEDAVLAVLRFSQQNGDMSALLGHVSHKDILYALDGSQDTEARRLMGLS